MRTRGRAGALYVVVTLCLAGCGDPGAPAPQAGGAPPAAEVAPQTSGALALVVGSRLDAVEFPQPGDDPAERRLASRGPPAAPVPESPLALDRSSPARLLDVSLLQALQLEDAAALARLSRPLEQPLDEDAVADAERRFLGPNTRTYWTRIVAAVRAGAYQVSSLEGDRADVLVEVGGAAGTYVVPMRKGDDGWYLAG